MTDLGEWGRVEDEELELQPLYYTSVDVFVRDQLLPSYRRDLQSPARTWCPEWWRHAEAISRLEALWRAWEHLRLDPATGISVWYRDHADHHMAYLLDSDGPFKSCSPERGHVARNTDLPLVEPPAGLFAPAPPTGQPEESGPE